MGRPNHPSWSHSFAGIGSLNRLLGQSLSHCRPQTGGVKNVLLSDWNRRSEPVACFGKATLHRLRNGRYELRGGSPAERAEAHEWASLFQHDAVFAPTPTESRR